MPPAPIYGWWATGSLKLSHTMIFVMGGGHIPPFWTERTSSVGVVVDFPEISGMPDVHPKTSEKCFKGSAFAYVCIYRSHKIQ